MTDTEKLNALADDIAAGFQQEPWRDQPGMGYVEIQMDKDDADEYRAIAARIAQLEAEKDVMAERIQRVIPVLRAFWTRFKNNYGHDSGCTCKGCDDVRTLLAEVADPALLAARDARMKREGALEALKGLRKSAIESIKTVLFESSGRHDGAARDSYCEGVQDVIVDLDAAIAALEQEGRNNG